jgi:hypothetical protein
MPLPGRFTRKKTNKQSEWIVDSHFYSFLAMYYQNAAWRGLVRISAGTSAILMMFLVVFLSPPGKC